MDERIATKFTTRSVIGLVILGIVILTIVLFTAAPIVRRAYIRVKNTTISTDCAQKNGRMVYGQLFGSPPVVGHCVLPTRDGGKLCADASECEYSCEADEESRVGKRPPTGRCSQWRGVVEDCGYPISGGEIHGWCF